MAVKKTTLPTRVFSNVPSSHAFIPWDVKDSMTVDGPEVFIRKLCVLPLTVCREYKGDSQAATT